MTSASSRTRRPAAALVAVVALVAALFAGVRTGTDAAAAGAAQAPARVPAQPYTWRNAEIVGGGFVPGIVFNEGERGLVYSRTDIGGAYRLDAGTGRWVPLLDWVGWERWGWTGVLSLAADPVDTGRVYAAVGTYTNSWDPGNGAILRSADRGRTWQAAELPFKLGGNMPGRGMGERLAVDPNQSATVYFGAPGGHGLWRSTDAGATWARVPGLTNPGDYADDPDDPTGYASEKQGVVWVTPDPRTGSPGTATRTVYAGVADKENPVYRSTDGGTTWAPVPGAPTGFVAHKGVLDAGTGDLFVATSDRAGPYDGAHGDVWRLATATGTWTRVSPVPSTDAANNYFGYSGLSVDRRRPGTLMVTAYSSWWPDTQIFRSTDGGATWTRAWEFTSYPNRSLRYRLDIADAPWLTFGANPAPPETTPKLGWMTEALAVDPFDSDRLMYGTGATIYGTTNLTAWDSGGTVDVSVMAEGLEETAVLDLVSPPSGAPLVSALGDVDGFRHARLDAVPPAMFPGPRYASSTSLDHAELTPSVLVRAGNADRSANPSTNRVAFSTDGGANWFQHPGEPPGVTGGGTVAAAADGSRFVWSPDGGSPHVTVGFGGGWTASAGLPAGAVVESDRVDPATFYGFAGGRFHVSRDGGATFTATAATGLPASGNVRFKAVPGRRGDVWLAGGATGGGGYGLWHSTDGGATFARVAGVEEADTIGFGKAAPGQTYPALYASARIDGVRGIHRSDTAGSTWVRVNDDAHQWGWTGSTITGDPRVYGRVYVGTNGRGVVYGDVAGEPATRADKRLRDSHRGKDRP
jgi:xyloglucan-specific exo-beta-1,4-glucanase